MSLMNFGFTKIISEPTSMENGRTEAKMASSAGSMKPEKKNLEKLTPKAIFKADKIKKSPIKISPSKLKGSTPQKTPTKNTESLNVFESESHDVSPKKSTDLNLPVQRVKMIMKSCPDVDIVPQEALHLITKATELFIVHLVDKSTEHSSASKLDYECLSNYVHDSDYLEFLNETVPKKITWAECQKLIEAKKVDNQKDLI